MDREMQRALDDLEKLVNGLRRDRDELTAALLALLTYHQNNRDPGYVEVSNQALLALERAGVDPSKGGK